MASAIKLGESLAVILPKSRCERFGWKKGQKFDWVEYPDGSQVLKPIRTKEASK